MIKKLFVAAVAAVMLTACGGQSTCVEDQAKDYAQKMEEAIQSGDMETVQALNTEIATWQESLSAEDQTKVLNVEEFATSLQEAAQTIVSETAAGAADAVDDAADAATSLGESVEDAANSVVDNAKSTAKEAVESAKTQAKDAANEAVNNAATKANEKANEAINNAANKVSDALKK